MTGLMIIKKRLRPVDHKLIGYIINLQVSILVPYSLKTQKRKCEIISLITLERGKKS